MIIYIRTRVYYSKGVVLGDPEVTANIYAANHATFPIQIRNITVQI